MTPSAQAATVFTSLASFMSNTQPGLFTNTFTGTSSATTLPFSNGVFSYVISSSTDVYANGNIVGANLTTDDITISFTSGNVTAIGGSFFQTDVGSNFSELEANSITVNLSDGTSFTRTPTGIDDYLGFTATAPIASLTLKSLGLEGRYVTLDNLSVGKATVVVPEGSTALLVLLACPTLAALAVVRRK